MLDALDWSEGRPLPEPLLEPLRRVVSEGRDLEIEASDPRGRAWSFALSPSADEGDVNLYGRDVTERKRAEHEREVAVEFLRLVNAATGTRELIHRAVSFFHEQSGCEAVGI